MTYLGDLKDWQDGEDEAAGNRRWSVRCVDFPECAHEGKRLGRSVQEVIQMGPCPTCGAPIVVEDSLVREWRCAVHPDYVGDVPCPECRAAEVRRFEAWKAAQDPEMVN